MFLSTGRCGTQWLTSTLRELHPEPVVAHEPLGPLYAPRRFFRCYAEPESILEVPDVAQHLRAVERTKRPYVETGWPLFPALPLLAERLGTRLRVVHLTRHPVPSAMSHLAHKSYAGSPRDDAYTRLATLGPRDPGAFQPQYADRWELLTPYEKCLFWWTEVHRFALEFAQLAPRVPLLRVRAEDMLAGHRQTLEALVEFMSLPWDDRWLERTRRRVDRWHHRSEDPVDPLRVMDHELTVEVARELDYDAGDIDVESLDERYHGQPDPGLDRIGRFATGEGACRSRIVPPPNAANRARS